MQPRNAEAFDDLVAEESSCASGVRHAGSDSQGKSNYVAESSE